MITRFDCIRIEFYGKFKCDGSFGLIKKLYRKITVYCVNHIVEVVKNQVQQD